MPDTSTHPKSRPASKKSERQRRLMEPGPTTPADPIARASEATKAAMTQRAIKGSIHDPSAPSRMHGPVIGTAIGPSGGGKVVSSRIIAGTEVFPAGIFLKDAAAYTVFYDTDPIERIHIVKTGIPAKAPGDIATRIGITKERLYTILGLPRATVERKVRDRKLLSPEESSRVLGIGRLIGQAQRMVEESGNPERFDAGAWVANWIETPVPALGGRRPAELMDTTEGQSMVATILSRAQTGAYS
jgi:putative toxin-antitoxin system antitoxin component (TIGR02293 family)